jgi:hypothetical protein
LPEMSVELAGMASSNLFFLSRCYEQRLCQLTKEQFKE